MTDTKGKSEATVTEPGKKLPRVRWALLVFLLPAAFYTAYVFRHLGEIDQRNLRLLGKASLRVEEVLEEAKKTVTNLGRNFDNAASFGVTHPFLRPLRPEDQKTLQGLQDWEIAWQASSQYFRIKNSTRPEPSVKPVFQERDSGLVLDAQIRAPTLSPSQENEIGSKPEGERKSFAFPTSEDSLEFAVDLDSLLDQLPIDYEFDHLLIVSNKSGKVIRQKSYRQPFGKSHSALRISQLDRLLAKPGEETEEDAQPLAFEDLRRSSFTKQVKLASGRFRLLCQPFAVPGLTTQAAEGSAGQADRGVGALCGLVSSERTLREALAVSPQLALALLLLLVVGLLAWPFVKLFAMGRRERFRFVDAYFLFLCTFASLLLGTVLLVDADTYMAFREEYRQSTREVAEQARLRIEAELESLYGQLEDYDDEVCSQLTGKPLDQFLRQSQIATSVEERSDSVKERSAAEASDLSLSLPAYDHFTSVFWVRPNGEQLIKGTVAERNTPMVSVSDRPYFRAIQEGRTFHLDAKREFFFQTFRSKTTGKLSEALSKRSCLTDRGDAEGAYVAVISTNLRSVGRPLLAPGLSLAVIDETGRVQFHSDTRRSLAENLVSEFSGGDRLRAVLWSRTAQHFETRYLARSHYVSVQPLRKMPFWVVAMFDEEIPATVNLEALFHSIFALSLYLLLANIPVLLIVALRLRRATWLWPDSEKRDFYWSQLALGLILIVLFGLAILYLPDTLLALFAWLIPLVSLSSTVANCYFWRVRSREKPSPSLKLQRTVHEFRRKSSDSQKGSGEGNSPSVVMRSHVAAAVCLWILMAVLPAYAAFRVAWRNSVEVAVRFEGLSLMEAVAEREGQTAKLLGGDRKDLYWFSPFDTSPAAAAPRPLEGEPLKPNGLGSLLADFKPIYNLSAARMAYLGKERADDRLLEWRRGPDGSIALRAEPTLFEGGLALRSASIDHGPHLGWFTWVGGAALVLLLAGWVGFSAFRLFFGRIDKQVKSVKVKALLEQSTSVIALISSPEDWKSLFQRHKGCSVVDLGGSDREATEKQIGELAESADGGVTICSRFVSGLADQKLRSWKLRQLQRLVFGESPRVLLPVAVNPFEGILRFAHKEGFGDRESEGAALTTEEGTVLIGGAETRRWSRLLAEFALQTVEFTPSSLDKPAAAETSQNPETDLENPDEAPRAHELKERRIDRLEGFYWSLWTSCSIAEQVTLVQLAQEGFVNPKQHRTVRRLLQRGLIRRDPRLRLMDETFELFVKRIHEPARIDKWERSGRGFSWNELRWGFLSLLLVITVFLFATQQGAFDVVLSFLSAVAVGGIPGLVRIALAVRRGGREATG